jgi:hypothetical protein
MEQEYKAEGGNRLCRFANRNRKALVEKNRKKTRCNQRRVVQDELREEVRGPVPQIHFLF